VTAMQGSRAPVAYVRRPEENHNFFDVYFFDLHVWGYITPFFSVIPTKSTILGLPVTSK